MQVLSDLALGRRIAVGGMAEVYEARPVDDPGAAPVVVKVLLPQHARDEELVRMLGHEARLNARLSHPNLVRVLGVDLAGRTPHLVMELVDGVTLAELLAATREADRPVPAEIAVYVVRALLAALAHVHSATDDGGRPLEIVHRDVTPHNVLLSRDGAVKLGDFGIARSALSEGRTRTGVIKGKLRYLAPEQVTGSSVDARTDLYAIGLVLFEMLTGAPYVEGGSEIELLRAAEAPPRRKPSAHGRAGFDDVVRRALERFPEARMRDADAFRAALDATGVEPAEPEALARLVREVAGPGREAAGSDPSVDSAPAGVGAEARTPREERVDEDGPEARGADDAEGRAAAAGASGRRRVAVLAAVVAAAAVVAGVALSREAPRPGPSVDRGPAPTHPSAREVGADPEAAPEPRPAPGRGEASAPSRAADRPAPDRPPPIEPAARHPGRPPSPSHRLGAEGSRPAHAPRTAPAADPAPAAAVEAPRPPAPDPPTPDPAVPGASARLATARRSLSARGILRSDLDAGTRAELAAIESLVAGGRGAEAEARVGPLEARLADLVVDAAFVRAKIDRVNARLAAARSRGVDTSAIDPLAAAALGDLIEGRHEATNRRLNEILRRLSAAERD